MILQDIRDMRHGTQYASAVGISYTASHLTRARTSRAFCVSNLICDEKKGGFWTRSVQHNLGCICLQLVWHQQRTWDAICAGKALSAYNSEDFQTKDKNSTNVRVP